MQRFCFFVLFCTFFVLEVFSQILPNKKWFANDFVELECSPFTKSDVREFWEEKTSVAKNAIIPLPLVYYTLSDSVKEHLFGNDGALVEVPSFDSHQSPKIFPYPAGGNSLVCFIKAENQFVAYYSVDLLSDSSARDSAFLFRQDKYDSRNRLVFTQYLQNQLGRQQSLLCIDNQCFPLFQQPVSVDVLSADPYQMLDLNYVFSYTDDGWSVSSFWANQQYKIEKRIAGNKIHYGFVSGKQKCLDSLLYTNNQKFAEGNTDPMFSVYADCLFDSVGFDTLLSITTQKMVFDSCNSFVELQGSDGVMHRAIKSCDALNGRYNRWRENTNYFVTPDGMVNRGERSILFDKWGQILRFSGDLPVLRSIEDGTYTENSDDRNFYVVNDSKGRAVALHYTVSKASHHYNLHDEYSLSVSFEYYAGRLSALTIEYTRWQEKGNSVALDVHPFSGTIEYNYTYSNNKLISVRKTKQKRDMTYNGLEPPTVLSDILMYVKYSDVYLSAQSIPAR